MSCHCSSTEYYMSASYGLNVQDATVLRSGNITVNSPQCLIINYYASSEGFDMEILSDRYQAEIFNLTIGDSHIYKDLPVGSSSYSILVRMKKSPGQMEEVKIYEFLLQDGPCPSKGGN